MPRHSYNVFGEELNPLVNGNVFLVVPLLTSSDKFLRCCYKYRLYEFMHSLPFCWWNSYRDSMLATVSFLQFQIVLFSVLCKHM